MEEDTYRIVIPEEIELYHEDPIHWWVDNAIETMVNHMNGDELYEMTKVVLAVATLENEHRLNGYGKASQIDWRARLEALKLAE